MESSLNSQGGLYLIRLSATHFYGGRAKNFRSRWATHLQHLQQGVHGNAWMQNVFNKHGTFEPEVLLEIEDEEEQVLAEQAWLDENHGQGDCVNLSPYANGGNTVVWNEEMRKKHSEAHTGHVRSPESRAKQSATLRASPELQEKARASLAENAKMIPPEAMTHRAAVLSVANKGRKLSSEHIEKIAAKHRGRKNTEETKKLMSESAKKRAVLAPTQHGQETRALISAQQKGRIWVNDGTRNQRVFPGTRECLELFEKGWATGRVQRQPPCPEQHPLSQE